MQPRTTTNHFSGPFVALPVWAAEEVCRSCPPTTLQVLVGMVALMERKSLRVTASLKQLSEYTHLSRETVKRSVKVLCDMGVVTIVGSTAARINVYVVNYTAPEVGSPVTLPTPSETSQVGSPVTLPRVGGGVSSDPTQTPETLAPQGFGIFSIEVLEDRDTGTRTVQRAASGQEDPVILGADPDDSPKEIPSPRARRGRPSGEVQLLVNHFMYHPQIVMSTLFTDKDVAVLRRTMRLILDGGVSRVTAVQMINQFLSVERFRTSDHPVLLFASKNIQTELLAAVGGAPTSSDPLLSLLLADFVREGLDIPWEVEHDDALRKAVISRGIEACYRYPELIADLALVFCGDFHNPSFISSLTALNDLVLRLSTDSAEDTSELVTEIQKYITLPSELKNGSRTSLRQEAGTIAEAVYRYRRASNAS